MRLSRFVLSSKKLGNPKAVYLYHMKSGTIAEMELNQYIGLQNIGRYEPSKIDKEDLQNLFDNEFIVESSGSDDLIVENWFKESILTQSILQPVILTTYNCNFSCPYCFELGKRSNGILNSDVSHTIATWLLSYANQIHSKEIHPIFFGGEPLMNVQAIKQISSILKRNISNNANFSFSMVTNGYLLGQRLCQELAEMGLKSVDITLDGPEFIHDGRRPTIKGRSTFNKIVANILEVRDLIKITIRVNIDNKNHMHLESLFEFLAHLGLQEHIKIKLALTKPSVENTDYCRDAVERDTIGGNYLLRAAYDALNAGFDSELCLNTSTCMASRQNSFAIDPVGNIYKCLNFAGLGMTEYAVGNIHKSFLDQSNNDYISLELWRKCKDCPYVFVCGGGCRFDAYVEKKDPFALSCHKELYTNAGEQILGIYRMSLMKSTGVQNEQ